MNQLENNPDFKFSRNFEEEYLFFLDLDSQKYLSSEGWIGIDFLRGG